MCYYLGASDSYFSPSIEKYINNAITIYSNKIIKDTDTLNENIILQFYTSEGRKNPNVQK